MARRKLPSEVEIHTSTFEDFDSSVEFDICLFAESFHYIPLAPALRQIARYGRQGAVIFDYFRRKAEHGVSPDSPRNTHAAFLKELERQGRLAIRSDEDLTEAIAPTFEVLDHLRNTHLAPFLRRARDHARKAWPVRSFLIEKPIGRRLDRLQRPALRAAAFRRDLEYRLITLAPV